MDMFLIITIQRRHQAGPDDLRNGQYGNLAVSVNHLPSDSALNNPPPPPTPLDGPIFDKSPTAEDVLQLIAESQRATHQIQRLNAQGVDTFSTSHLLPQPEAVGTSKGPVIFHCSADVGSIQKTKQTKIKLGPTKIGLFEQPKRDTTLLQDLSMMDFSLIVALPNAARGNKEGLWDDQLLVLHVRLTLASCVASFTVPAAISSVGLTGVASGGVGGNDWVVICAHSASAESVELRNGQNTLR
ncbi:hypothetical protein PTTG_26422 [Puccinia triticina 1-1 BBBD Race 1]|uniref:Uncharacterized protein n=2 Tax=Puccinia triticina TaxID=208348 RepID=A0A180GTU9_PUCT1|nr:uncharacterized protein PtA15_7A728 [Puccinia triticina]OAV96226.1 hypothetical protein PTTG_26422 [Puccinia triticina 1-1 BBBD Race 1]WAQ86999.1 hypothetical protein PtA15_7A728 [Puccinia triticina]